MRLFASTIHSRRPPQGAALVFLARYAASAAGVDQ